MRIKCYNYPNSNEYWVMKMSFVLNTNNQLSIADRYNNLTDRERQFLDNSWAKPFSNFVFPAINEQRFAVLYSSNSATRPNTPVNVIVGALIIKEILHLTDEEVLTGLMFDVRMQYALHTTSNEEQPLSDRTLSRFRERLHQHELATGDDLLKEEILSLGQEIAKLMKLSPNIRRMDSMMIASACKDMTRLEVVYVTVANLVNAVHRIGEDELLVGLEQYLKDDNKNRVIYHNRTEERATKIQNILEDGALLIKRMGDAGVELPEYTLAQRMLFDQCTTNEAGEIEAKSNQDISPSSLQNPSDPDATYRKKGEEGYIGYSANLVETVDMEVGGSAITYYSFENNRHSDSAFGKEAIEHIAATEEIPAGGIIMLGDGAFASKANSELAESKNMTLVTTASTGPQPHMIFADFEIDEQEHQVTSCPAGHEPIRQSMNEVTGTHRVVMDKACCENCPNRGACNARMQVNSAVVMVSENKVRRARVSNNAAVTPEEYANYRNIRNGVESLPSLMRRICDVDNMPVYGLMRSKLFFGLKVAAINVKKLCAFLKKKSGNVLQSIACPQVKCAQI